MVSTRNRQTPVAYDQQGNPIYKSDDPLKTRTVIPIRPVSVTHAKRQAKDAKRPKPNPQAHMESTAKFMHAKVPPRKRTDWQSIEATYDQLSGNWHDWLQVARLHEKRIPIEDRQDMRHTIIFELAKANRHSRYRLAIPQCHRIASNLVAEYYYERAERTMLVDCKHCKPDVRRACLKNDLFRDCPKVKPVLSLDAEVENRDGELVTLEDVLIDDNLIDLDAWLDAKAFLHGSPKRLVEIAVKLYQGVALNNADRKYLCQFRKLNQLSLKLGNI